MNAKAARLARQVNRIAGRLVKREQIVMPEQRHKLSRKVKQWWASLDHRARGRNTRYWMLSVDESRAQAERLCRAIAATEQH